MNLFSRIKNTLSWIIFMSPLIVLIYALFKPETKQLITVDSNDYKIEYVKNDDSRLTNLWKEGKAFIINNTNENLILESLIYTNYENFNDDTELILITKGIKSIDSEIHYIFSDPPNKLRVKGGGKRRKWWLHR